jgi:hypothetical protein
VQAVLLRVHRKVQPHDYNRSKVGARKPLQDVTNTISTPSPSTTTASTTEIVVLDLEEKITAAIRAKRSVFIQYDAAVYPREIRPLRTEKRKQGLLIHAICIKKNAERSFYARWKTTIGTNHQVLPPLFLLPLSPKV